jgi:hypothetical protein
MTRIISILTILILSLYFFTVSSCQKELSCEGCRDPTPPGDTSFVNDTAKIDSTLKLAACNSCDSTKPLALNSWGLKANGSYICGEVENSLFSGGSSFDFWGYLQCSRDTGFRIVSFFDQEYFNADAFNVSTTLQSMILQDEVNYMNPWAGYILRTDLSTTPWHTLRIVVDTFLNATKLMVGRFYGYAYTKNDDKTYVEGRFRFIVH